MFTVQLVPETESQPIQPEKTELASRGPATSVTCLGGFVFGKVAVHPAVDPVVHEIPSALVIVPFPVPPACAVSTNVLGAKVAVTVFAYSMETVQVVSFTESHPVQPVNSELASGAATSVTCVAGDVLRTGVAQPAVEPLVHVIPPPEIVPFPIPPVRAVSSHVLGAKVAVTVFAAVIETVQVSVTLVQPDHDWKIELESGAATRVTSVAGVVLGTLVEHPVAAPGVQLMPGPVTVPPAFVPVARTFRA
jgi:hypothetical protein